MIKFFRKIRQQLITDNKVSKYLIYAIGEIILVVIGILIALSLNTYKENRDNFDLGNKYLIEMRKELQSDFFDLDGRIRRLNWNIQNHEAALRTQDIDALPMDSVRMILNPVNLDFEIKELTFNRMKNLGITSLTSNEALNSQISDYYNSTVVNLKLSMDFVFEDLRKYQDFFHYKQDEIDLSLIYDNKIEFPSLYDQSIEEVIEENRLKSISFIKTTRGRAITLGDLNSKRYSLDVLKSFRTRTQDLLVSIYEELERNNLDVEPLPEFPSDEDFIEIAVEPEELTTYTGTFQSGTNKLVISIEDDQLYLISQNTSATYELTPTAENKFYIYLAFIPIEFLKENDDITGFSLIQNGYRTDFLKIDD